MGGKSEAKIIGRFSRFLLGISTILLQILPITAFETGKFENYHPHSDDPWIKAVEETGFNVGTAVHGMCAYRPQYK